MAIKNKTWTEFVQELEQKIFQSTDDGSWKVLSVSNVDGTAQSFTSMEEALKMLELAKGFATTEDGASNRSAFRPVRLRQRNSRR